MSTVHPLIDGAFTAEFEYLTQDEEGQHTTRVRTREFSSYKDLQDFLLAMYEEGLAVIYFRIL